MAPGQNRISKSAFHPERKMNKARSRTAASKKGRHKAGLSHSP
jgi:hypothetical protein